MQPRRSARPFLLLILASLSLLAVMGLASALSVTFNNPTPANGSVVNSKNVTINLDANPLSSVVFNWNGTNYSVYDPSLVLAYNFDNVSALGENDTRVKDISQNQYNATVYGETSISWNTSGRFGGGYSFSSKGGDYMNVTALNLTTGIGLNWSNSYSVSIRY